MKRRKTLLRHFGKDEFNFINLPKKVSGTKISRSLYGEIEGCSICFPHGWETYNSKFNKDLKCWKRYRNKQYH